jgi:Uma2 family endonuclease
MSAQWRYDLRDGHIRPCPQSDITHSGLIVDLMCAVSNRLDDSPYEVFLSSVRIVIDPERCFLHPDLSVVDRDPRLMPPMDNISLLEPRVVFEIYSSESEADDRGDRFRQYQRVASLLDDVLLDERRPHVETFRRQPDGAWVPGEVADDASGTFALRSLEVVIPLAEVYKRMIRRATSGRG